MEPTCCVVLLSLERNQGKTTGGKLHHRLKDLLWYYFGDWKSASFIIESERWKNMDLELWRLRFGRTNASIRQAALIWRRDFDVQETETWFQIGTMLQYRCFMHKPIYRCIDRGWLCWMSLYLRGWIRTLQRVRPAVTRLTVCVCFHIASHDWTVIDGQSITQEAHWKPIIVAPHRTRPLHEQCLSRQSFVLGGLSVCHSVHLSNARQTNLNLNDLSSEDYIRPEFSITQQTAIDIWSEN